MIGVEKHIQKESRATTSLEDHLNPNHSTTP